MKRSHLALYVGALAGSIGIAAVGFSAMSRGTASEPAAERFALRRAPPAASGALDTLWKFPEFSFPSHRGNVVTGETLRGHPFIANFFFTTCTTVCPPLTAKLVMLQRELRDPALRFVSLSVDPDNDTREALKQYAERWKREETRWMLLRTRPDGLERFARGMRVAVEHSDDEVNPIIHSSLFFLVDGAGTVRGVYSSNDAVALERLVRDARTLLEGSGSPDVETDGARLYASLGCDGCHGRPELAPRLEGLLGREVMLEGDTRVTADEEYIREAIASPGARVVEGYLRLMPSYQQHLDPSELQALVDHVVRIGGQPFAVAEEPSTPRTAASPGRPAPAEPESGGSLTVPSPAASAIADPPAAIGSSPPRRPAAARTVLAKKPTAAPEKKKKKARRVVTDPVCSMKVRVVETTPRASHGGHTHHFCSPMCRDRFAKDPSRFTKR